MQFFIFGRDFKKTVKILHDQHVFKLCIELCQVLLITSLILLEDRDTKMVFASICMQNLKVSENEIKHYLRLEEENSKKKLSYINHPFVDFARRSRQNYHLLHDLSKEYYREASLRFPKQQKEKTNIMIEIIHTFLFQGYSLCRTYEQWSRDTQTGPDIPPICSEIDTVQLYNRIITESGLIDTHKLNIIRRLNKNSNAFISSSWKDYFLFQQFAYYYNNKGSGRYLHTSIPSLLTEGPVLDHHIVEATEKRDFLKNPNSLSKIFYNKLVHEFLNHLDTENHLNNNEIEFQSKNRESMTESYIHDNLKLKEYLLKLANQVDN